MRTVRINAQPVQSRRLVPLQPQTMCLLWHACTQIPLFAWVDYHALMQIYHILRYLCVWPWRYKRPRCAESNVCMSWLPQMRRTQIPQITKIPLVIMCSKFALMRGVVYDQLCFTFRELFAFRNTNLFGRNRSNTEVTPFCLWSMEITQTKMEVKFLSFQ